MHTYKTFVIDFDSTLVTCESLDELAALALRGHPRRTQTMAELTSLTRQGMEGAIGFDASLQKRLQLFQANKSHVTQLVTLLKQHLSPTALQSREWFARHQQNIYVLSGGFADYIVPVVGELGLHPDNVFANRFTYNHRGDITGFSADSPLCRAGGKVDQLAALNLPRPLVMIGDGHTDYEVKARGQADQFWALTENITRPPVVAKADRVLAGFAEL